MGKSTPPPFGHLLCRGGFAKLSPLLEEMPDRAGGYIILGLTPETRSAESLVSLAVRLGLANAFFAFSCMCCVDIPGVCFGDGFCFDTAFAALVSLLLSCAKLTQGDVLLFFFTKKKKRSKKRKDLAYPCSERQCMPRLAVFSQLTRNINPPEGQTGGFCRRNTAFLDR